MTENKIKDVQYNADEMVAPEWLNAEFITGILSKYEKEPKLKVMDLKISPASGKNDHYASVMFRVSVDYETEKGKFSKSLIVKTMPEQDGYKKNILSDSHLFETEIGMYSEVLLKFEIILQEVRDKTKLYVPCIYYSLQQRRILIFDDLVPLGYSVMRNREPTVEELKCPLEILAKWHAVSMKVLYEQPDFLKDYKHGLIEMPNISDMINLGIDNFIEMLNEQPDLMKYKTYFEKIKVDYLELLKNYLAEYRNNRREDTYYVLNHGDFHLRNMLFKHSKETGNLEDCMLVDFQGCNLCPISVDLVYSVYTLMSHEQRLNDWENLFNYYFSILLETLKKIGYKGALPTPNKFWNQIYRAKYYDFFLVCGFLPMMWAMRANSVDIAEVVQKNEARQKCYQIQGYLEDVKNLFARFERLGYFKNL